MSETVFLTVDEASQRLRVSPDTIRRLLRDRKLRGARVGGQWRIPAEALEEVGSPRGGELLDEAIEILVSQEVEGTTIPAGTVGYVVVESRGVGCCYADTITFRETAGRDSSPFPDLVLNRADLGRTWRFVPDNGSTRIVPKTLLRQIKKRLNQGYSTVAQRDRDMAFEDVYWMIRQALGPNERTDEQDDIPQAIARRIRQPRME